MIQIVPVTGIYAALCAILVIALSLQVVRQRRRARVGQGDGGDQQLARAIRVHANATENLPLALILLLVLELNGVDRMLLHLLGLALLFARLLHAWGLTHSGGVSFGRFYGAGATWLVMLCAAALSLYLGLS